MHTAFHPDVLDQFGKSCKNNEERDALIRLAIAYVEDQNKVKLSTHYFIQDFEFKGNTDNISEDFGLAKDPMKEEFEKLAKTFAPVADIATRDPELIDQMTRGDKTAVTKEEVISDIKIPGLNTGKLSKGATKLIEEVKITPTYTLLHRNSTNDSTRCIIVKVDLEKVENVQQCTLDITEVSVKCKSLNKNKILRSCNHIHMYMIYI